MLAPCGLDCDECRIHLAPAHPEIAAELVTQFRQSGHSQAEPGWFHCAGCPGDRLDHWSLDCEILACCVDEKQFHHCAACESFPCGQLKQHAAKAPRYAAALQRLNQYRTKE